jgi:hypothetical protein
MKFPIELGSIGNTAMVQANERVNQKGMLLLSTIAANGNGFANCLDYQEMDPQYQASPNSSTAEQGFPRGRLMPRKLKLKILNAIECPTVLDWKT